MTKKKSLVRSFFGLSSPKDNDPDDNSPELFHSEMHTDQDPDTTLDDWSEMMSGIGDEG